MSEASKETRFLAEVTMTLIQAASAGASGGGREVSERLRKLAKGCLALRYKRLYWILDALATRLAKPRPEMAGAPLEELGRLLADARYTCKAIKSLQGGTLSDARVQQDLIGTHDRRGTHPLEDRSLIRVGRQATVEGDVHYRTSYLLDPMDGQLYSVRELSRYHDGQLESPFLDLGDCPRIHLGRVLPSFSPARLEVEAGEPGARNESGLREYLETRAPDSVGGLLTSFRSQREEYLSPRTLPVIFRPAGFMPGLQGGLVDRHANLLPLLSEPASRAQCDHLAHLLRTPQQDIWGVFGRLVFLTGTFWFWPWAMLTPEGEDLVTFL